MWDLIVSVPDHCLSFYLVGIMKKKKKKNNNRIYAYIFLSSPTLQSEYVTVTV